MVQTDPGVGMMKRRGLRWALAAGAALLALYLGASYAVFTIALTPLRKPHDQTPVSAGLRAQEVWIESAKDRTRLYGFFLPGGSDRAIVMVHGVDSNCWDGNDREIARAYLARGYSVMLFDLRAQGSSEGKLLGLGWKERDDVLAAVRYLLGRGFKGGRIGIHGSSYGAATAILAAAYIPEIGAVAADSPFADIRDMMEQELRAKLGFGKLFGPGVLLVSSLFFGLDLGEIAPIKALPKIAPRPVFLLHGGADSRIPVEHSKRLKAASGNPKDILWIVPEAEHTKEFNLRRDEFIKRTTEFFAGALR